MKIILYIFSTMALLVSLTQCTKADIQDSDITDKIQVMFTTVQGGTKSEIQDMIGSLKLFWESGDKVWAYDGTKCLGSLEIRPADVGKELATFEGSITKPSGSAIRFIYFGSSITVPESASTTVDYYSQDGNLATLKTKLIADCDVTYIEGQTLFSGTFNVPFAIGKFKFSGTDFSAGDKILVTGLMQTISVSATGNISYGAPSAAACAELIYQPATLYYIAMPADGTNNKVCFHNASMTKEKGFSKDIVNGIYYYGASGISIDVFLE